MAKRVQQFGGEHTEQKQDVVLRYLGAYATALRNSFHISYVDAFAGCGWRVDAGVQPAGKLDLFSQEPPPPVKPSAGTALKVLLQRPGFHRYVFGDRNQRHLAALREAVSQAEAKARVQGIDFVSPEFFHADANVLVARECARLVKDSKARTVMFLDPFGMQVSWTTMQAVAGCQRADMWLLGPTDIALNRLVPRNGPVPEGWARALTRFYGDESWRNEFVGTEEGLFGSHSTRKADRATIINFTMRRLGGLFGGGLYHDPLELTIKGRPAYHLVFACANPAQTARNLSFELASYILNRSKNQKSGR